MNAYSFNEIDAYYALDITAAATPFSISLFTAK